MSTPFNYSWRSLVLKLYRRILQTHREKLPFEMRAIGDKYVSEEFQLHKTANQRQAEQFVRKWKEYLDTLRAQRNLEELGKPLADTELQGMNEEQMDRLSKLHGEAVKLAEHDLQKETLDLQFLRDIPKAPKKMGGCG